MQLCIGQSLLRCLELSLHLHREGEIAETRLAMIDDHQCESDGDEKGIGGNIVRSCFCVVDMDGRWVVINPVFTDREEIAPWLRG